MNQHPNQNRTFPKKAYAITDDAYLNMPFEEKTPEARFWNGIKNIYDLQNRVTINNFHHLGLKSFKYTYKRSRAIMNGYIADGLIEEKF